MMARSAEQWAELIAEKTPEALAKHVLGDLIHYRHNGIFEEQDQQQIINLITAAQRNAAVRTE